MLGNPKSTMPESMDDKSQYCIPFILEQLEIHQKKHGGKHRAPPFFLGMNGVQGVGKTTLVSCLRMVPLFPHDLRIEHKFQSNMSVNYYKTCGFSNTERICHPFPASDLHSSSQSTFTCDFKAAPRPAATAFDTCYMFFSLRLVIFVDWLLINR